ncbi:MAG TPA: hypothetical protein VGU70_22545 [Methylobacterium sp.]|uniref:hypothetical protein n=1 Tax=Methylorubrum sp. B1-46 TaxID=2897334 RepID=UPI001E364648|nr:hypothetical protein [Methylorubrum sp. B1-46]UGB25216.1 hypothetical protein LPC10_20315 [Methylorubrum sp. B1-46]HEV2545533.1 hypothetical protein [Methylobacterium sp.]
MLDAKSQALFLSREWIQGSLHVGQNEDLAKLFAAITALKALPWCPASMRDLRACRVEQRSDFTATVKG